MSATAAFDRRDQIDVAAAGLMLGLTFSWGLNYVAAKLSYSGFDPVFLSIARSVIGGALVFLWCRWRGVALFERDGTLIAGAAVGVLFGLEFLCLYIGLELTSVARSTLLVNAMPFWMLIGGHFLLGEHFTPRKLIGLVLAFAGLVAVFSDKLGADGQVGWLGDLLAVSAGILWAATNIIIKRSRLNTISAEKVLLYQLAGAAVVGLIVMPFSGPAIREVTPLTLFALGFQSIYIVAFTYVLWFWLLRRYPASGLASFAFLSPVFGVLCGALFLHETLSLRVFLALALIAVGLVVVNRSPRRQIPV
jgi:drug/metabolite transporter (DMT)-like permease